MEEVEANNIETKRDGNTSFLKTIFNGLNALIGVGILSVPYALTSGGWLSLVFLVAISGAAYYSGLLIKRCMDANPSTIQTYSDIGEFAFGKAGKIVISIFVYVDLYLALTGFLILEGDNLQHLFPGMRIDAFGKTMDANQSFVFIIALVLLPTVWLDSLSILAYISATGVVASVVILASVLWVGAIDGVGFHNKGQLLNWKGLPTAISLYVFSYSANTVFPTLYTSMEKKHHFSKVLILGFLCATICYTSMAILGYLMFGSELQSQITLNLPAQKVSSKISIYTAWITPLSKYALMMKPVANVTESWFPSYSEKRLFRIFVRTILVVTQVIIALSIPFFGALMSLVGALFSATTSITIPCLCYLKIVGAKKRLEKVFIMILVLLSIVIVVVGTYTSMVSIVKQTTKHFELDFHLVQI